MTSTDTNIIPESEKPAKRRSGFLGLFMVITMLAACVAVIAIWENVKSNEYASTRDAHAVLVQSPVVDVSRQVSSPEIEVKLQQLEDRLNSLTSRIEKLEQGTPASVADDGATKAAANSDIVKLKDDLSTLTLAMGDVQTKLQQSAVAADKNHFADQASLVAIVSYNQLRNVAETGESFAAEYQSFYQAAAYDAALQEVAGKLEPLSAQGVPNLAMLREEFTGLKHAAQTAVNRAEAKTWKDRVAVELQGMVSVRPLHPEATEQVGLDGIESDLAQHKLVSAIEKTDALPETARNTLKDWRTHIEARQKLDDALKAIAGLLVKPRVNDAAPVVKEP